MTYASRKLDVYDAGNGALQLAWQEFPASVPTSYNVYVNGALNQNVASGRRATVTGLTEASYNSSTGVKTAPGTYTLNVTAVLAGVEIASSLPATVTMSPNSVMLVTPMRRPFPFPNVDS